MISFSYKHPPSPPSSPTKLELRRSVDVFSPIPYELNHLVTKVLLSSAELGLLDRLGAVDGSLSVSLSADAIVVFKHGAGVGDRGARAPKVGVEGEDYERE